MQFGVGLFNGLGIGFEHMDNDGEDGIAWCITFEILCIRFYLIKLVGE